MTFTLDDPKSTATPLIGSQQRSSASRGRSQTSPLASSPGLLSSGWWTGTRCTW